MHLNNHLKEFVALLSASNIEFLVVGGVAVAWHGWPRFSDDIDIFARPGTANAEALARVLKDFGFSGCGTTVGEDEVLDLGSGENRVDVMTSITAVSFDEAWASRVMGEIDGVAIPYIGLKELLRNKEATGRGLDGVDAHKLRERNPEVK